MLLRIEKDRLESLGAVGMVHLHSEFLYIVVKSQPTSDAAFFVLKPFLRIIHFRNASVS